MAVGIVAGPPGMVVGSFLGAVIGAMLGGTTGALAGAKLGEVVDGRILDNYLCLACRYTFSSLPPEAPRI